MMRHIKVVGFFLFILLGCAIRLFAQSEISDTVLTFQKTSLPKITVGQWFGNNFNPGIKAGLGGSHIYGYYPQLSMKLANTSWQFSFINGEKANAESFQGNLDLFCWDRTNPKYRDYITLTLGYEGVYQRQSENYQNKQFMLVGWSRYFLDRRILLNAQFGQVVRKNKDILINKGRTQTTGGFYSGVGFTYSLFQYKSKPTSAETRRLYSKTLNPYFSLGIGADRVVLFPAFGVKCWDLNFQFVYARVIWHDVFTGSIEYLLPGSRNVSENRVRKLSLQASVQGEGGGGLSQQMISLQFGRNHYFMDKHKSKFLRAGIGLFSQYSSGVNRLQPFPVLSFGVSFHAFKFYREDFESKRQKQTQ